MMKGVGVIAHGGEKMQEPWDLNGAMRKYVKLPPLFFSSSCRIVICQSDGLKLSLAPLSTGEVYAPTARLLSLAEL